MCGGRLPGSTRSDRRSGCAFSILRLTGLFDFVTGLFTTWSTGAWPDHDHQLLYLSLRGLGPWGCSPRRPRFRRLGRPRPRPVSPTPNRRAHPSRCLFFLARASGFRVAKCAENGFREPRKPGRPRVHGHALERCAGGERRRGRTGAGSPALNCAGPIGIPFTPSSAARDTVPMTLRILPRRSSPGSSRRISSPRRTGGAGVSEPFSSLRSPTFCLTNGTGRSGSNGAVDGSLFH